MLRRNAAGRFHSGSNTESDWRGRRVSRSPPRLSRRGWLATVTMKNSPDTDVLAQHPESERLIRVQTKTASPGQLVQAL
jgi:hypothetical protein